MNIIDIKQCGYDRVVDMKRIEFILKELSNKVPPNGDILDVGCGNGVISRLLGKYGYQVQGIDVSDKAIETARKLTVMANVRFDVMSAEELRATKVKYDAIICSEVLEHLHDPSSLLQVLYDSLKDGGRLVVTVPNGNGPREMLVTKPVISLRNKNNRLWRMILRVKTGLGYSGTTVQSDADNLDHVQFFSKKDLKQLSSSNNFRIVKFGSSNFIEDVFPLSLVSRRSRTVQRVDCKLADILPVGFTGGFMTIWEKNII